MFVLNELDELLNSLFQPERKKIPLKISLVDVKRIDVEKLKLSTGIRYPTGKSELLLPANRSSKPPLSNLIPSPDYGLSTDRLFLRQINTVILTKLNQVPERQYASAKLVICDRTSHDILLKLKRITSTSLRNFIFKPPFNVTAIFLLDLVVDLFDRQREPILIYRYDRSIGQQIISYNYPLARKVFPYLKMSDIIVLLDDKQQMELGIFDINSKREHQIIQLLNQFARSVQIIELSPINKLLGKPHLIYDNALIIGPYLSTDITNLARSSMCQKLPLSQVTHMAHRLVKVAEQMGLQLKSITFRVGDNFNQTKAFSLLAKTELDSQRSSHPTVMKSPEMVARVLVLDRLCDLHGTLSHADRYGAFLEQEELGEGIIKSRIDSVHELDEKLQFEQLTDVLGTILKYAIQLRPNELELPKGKRVVQSIERSLSSAMLTSQSIRRHLDMVKILYKCLNEGYLLILRLESSLESASSQLRNLTAPLLVNEQRNFAERLERIYSAYKQLIKISGKSIRALDCVRVASLLLDVINMFTFIHNNTAKEMDSAHKTLKDIRQFLLNSREFKKALESKADTDDGAKFANILMDKLTKFDSLSRETCGQRSIWTIEQVISNFYHQQLEQGPYTTIDLLPDANMGGKNVIIVLLGAMTPQELSQVKMLETSLRREAGQGSLGGVCVLTMGLAKPGEFLLSL